MAQTNINIRMDDEMKRDFDRVCNELGINMTVAITILAKKMIREQRIPFEVSIDPFYSQANMSALRHSAEQLREGKVTECTLDELEGMADE